MKGMRRTRCIPPRYDAVGSCGVTTYCAYLCLHFTLAVAGGTLTITEQVACVPAVAKRDASMAGGVRQRTGLITFRYTAVSRHLLLHASPYLYRRILPSYPTTTLANSSTPTSETSHLRARAPLLTSQNDGCMRLALVCSALSALPSLTMAGTGGACATAGRWQRGNELEERGGVALFRRTTVTDITIKGGGGEGEERKATTCLPVVFFRRNTCHMLPYASEDSCLHLP